MNEAEVQEIERVVAAARDSLTDDMVARLTGALAEGLDLLDRANRADLGNAIPVLSRLVANGDLERLTHLARVVAAAEDAVTEDMVLRLAETVGHGLSIVDRLHRAGADRVIGALERLSAGGGLERMESTLQRLASCMVLMERMFRALEDASAEMKSQPIEGGFGGYWRLMRDPENQQTLRFMLAVARRIRADQA